MGGTLGMKSVKQCKNKKKIKISSICLHIWDFFSTFARFSRRQGVRESTIQAEGLRKNFEKR